MRIDLGYSPSAGIAEAKIHAAVAWEAPLLPSNLVSTVPRLAGSPAWVPPGTIVLARHRALDGRKVIVTDSRVPPPGYVIEFDLGSIHGVEQPGTARLLATAVGFTCIAAADTPPESEVSLGFVEQAPLPLLDALEVRRDPTTGQLTLVSGPSDPLFGTAEPLGVLGYIESYPLNPRTAAAVRADRGMRALTRHPDREQWTHRYTVAPTVDPGAVALGGVWLAEHQSTVALTIIDGLIRSPLLNNEAALAASKSVKTAGRWAIAPLTWSRGRPRRWAFRATASRARFLVRRARPATGAPQVIGYARAHPTPAWGAVFSAVHPVVGDQYLTRSPIEATDMGYIIEGLLGYFADRWSSPQLALRTDDIVWASRFGQHRRYVEDPAD